MKNLNEIMQKLKDVKPVLESDYEVEELGVFGSYVRGEQKEESDIDVMVSLRPGHSVGLIEFCGLKDFLTNILGIKVDLVTKNGLRRGIKQNILNEVVYL